MRPRLVVVILVAWLTAQAVPAVAAVPTKKQVRAAVRRAKSSRNLWATINRCDSAQRKIGIRGQMPSLGFATRMYLNVQLESYSNDFGNGTGGWQVVVNATKWVSLGKATHSTRQNGVDFLIDPSPTPYLLRGLVTFQWKRGGEVVGQATRVTTVGHRRDLGKRGRASCTI